MIGVAKKKRVLLVTNALPPTMPADSQRARMLAYTLTEMGWDVEILVPGADFQILTYRDAQANALQLEGIKVYEVAPAKDRLLRALGMRSMSWRALWPLYRRGCYVLRKNKFDLVYITTAQFNFFCLGRLWQRKFGVPYILDFHDPWFRKANDHMTTRRNWKYRVSTGLAKHMEAFALKRAAGLVAVSPVYLDQLRHRYPGFRCVQPERTAAIPFGVSEKDYVVAQAVSPLSATVAHAPISAFSVSAFQRFPQTLDIIYVGAGRSIMAKSFRRICQGLARLKQREPDIVETIKIRLFGTYAYWQPGDPKELQALAESEGVGELVEEKPARIGYIEALKLALQADGLLVLGVDDPAYMPSKLFLYALTGKPLLACMHANSQVNDYFRRFPELGTLIHFSGPVEAEATEDEKLLEFLRQVAARQTFARENIRGEFSAAAMAKKHAELFDKILSAKTDTLKF
jgi:glycosyltransferase involved in cell wall biosynthesis